MQKSNMIGLFLDPFLLDDVNVWELPTSVLTTNLYGVLYHLSYWSINLYNPSSLIISSVNSNVTFLNLPMYLQALYF